MSPFLSLRTDLGLPALRSVLDLLDAPDLMTRKRAGRVLEGVIMRAMVGCAETGIRATVMADAPSEERKAAIEKWRDWSECQQARKAIL